MNMCSVHFIMFIHFYLVDVRHFENHIVVFLGSFWRPVWPNALGSRLVYLNAAPALIRRCCSK